MFSKFIRILVVITVIWVQSCTAYSPQSPSIAHAEVLSEKTYSLSDRYWNTYVNNVFADNILLTLAYMRGTAKEGQPVDWGNVTGNFTYTLTIQPGQTFAFHNALLPQYQNKPVETTNAHFNSNEGFKSDGWLVGDGVCHLASFMNVVARNAHLDVLSPTPHDFARIPDVPRQLGVAIFYLPDELGSSSMQNLYITNTFEKPITFVFTHAGDTLTIQVEKRN